MSLLSYKAPTRSVTLGDTTMLLRGLGAADISTLIQSNADSLELITSFAEKLFAAKNGGAQDSTEALLSLATEAIKAYPGVAATAIALGVADEDSKQAEFIDIIGAAGSLPIGLQVEALQAIFELTFTEVGSIKKLWNRIQTLRGPSTPVKSQKATPSKSSKAV